MRITVRTGGLLDKYLPPGSEDHMAELDLPDGLTPADVMQNLGLPADQSYLVVLNGVSIPKAERAERQLADDDELEILPPLRGG